MTSHARGPVLPVPLPRPMPSPCALCGALSASPFGLCLRCLADAAAELARLVPHPPGLDGGAPSSVPFRALCTRCGRPGHDQRECDA